jgi:hypothetical protein
MDDRVRLVRKVGGGSYFRITEPDLETLGMAGLVAELEARNMTADDLGTPKLYPLRREWRIAIRKGHDE